MNGWGAFAQELQNFGGSTTNLAQTYYRMDAEQKAAKEELNIAREVEQWKRDIASDPDHGTPGQPDGYMKKWKEKQQEIQTRIDKIDNPLAKQTVSRMWAHMAESQTTAVFNLQRAQWGKATIAERMEMNRQLIEESGLPVDVALEEVNENIRFLHQNNLIDASEKDQQTAAWTQQTILADLERRAQEEYAQNGYAAVERMLAGESQTYTSDGKPYRASDKTKDYVLSKIQRIEAANQRDAEEMFEDYYTKLIMEHPAGIAPDERAEVFLQMDTMRTQTGYQPPADIQYRWKQRIEIASNAAQTGAGSADADLGKQMFDSIKAIMYAIERSETTNAGVGKATTMMYDPKLGKYREYSATREILDAYLRNPEIARGLAAAGLLGEAEKLRGSTQSNMPAPWATYEKSVQEKATPAQLREFRDMAVGEGAKYNADQVKKYVDEYILGPAYKNKLSFTFSNPLSHFQYGKTNEAHDAFARDSWDGKFIPIFNAQGEIQNPNFKNEYTRAVAQQQKLLEALGHGETVPIYVDGRVLFQGDPAKAKSLPSAAKSGPGRDRVKPIANITYELAPVGASRDSRWVRTISYDNGEIVIQAYEQFGDKTEWVDLGGALPGYYPYKDPAGVIQRLETKRDDRKAQMEAELFGYSDAAQKRAMEQIGIFDHLH